ncbi:MAG: SDR family oxidoreductase [Bacteroidota bacterium]|jgi:dTDP-glucose 4,6-dehydratase/UDP-glucose 4-epimerase
MNILIIGSKGFIGSHCVNYFKNKNYQVFEAGVSANLNNNPFYSQLNGNNTNFDALFKQQQYDLCINASGSAHVGFSFDKPDIDFELNVLNVHKILVSIRTYQPKCKFINFSSAAVYGNPEKLPIAEESSKNPLSPYGFHKLQSEYLLKEYHRFFGLSTCSLRVFSAYGPGLKKQLFWDLYQKATQNPEQIEVYGTGAESRDFIYIDDLIKGIDLIFEKAPFDGNAFNISSGIETPIKEVVKQFYQHLNPGLKFTFNNIQKQGDPNNWQADVTHLQKLGFKTLTSLNEGLLNTANWLNNL